MDFINWILFIAAMASFLVALCFGTSTEQRAGWRTSWSERGERRRTRALQYLEEAQAFWGRRALTGNIKSGRENAATRRETETSPRIFCSFCGADFLSPTDAFCPNCGGGMATGSPFTSKGSQSEGPKERVAAFCSSCGAASPNEKAAFCANCGDPIAGRKGVAFPHPELDPPATQQHAPSLNSPQVPLVLGLGGSAALIIGAGLPWMKVAAPFIGTVTKSAVEGGDGWLVIGLGITAAVFCLRNWAQPRAKELRSALMITGFAAAAFTFFVYVDISDRFAEVRSEIDAEEANSSSYDGMFGSANDLLYTSYGPGLFLSAAGSAALVIGAFAAGREGLERDEGP